MGIEQPPKKPAGEDAAKSAEELRGLSFYERLGLSLNASEQDIKSARKVMFNYHPDHGGDSEAMKLVNEAYGTLSDPALRAAYDTTLQTPLSGADMSRSQQYTRPDPRPFWEETPQKSKEAVASPEEIDATKGLVHAKLAELISRDPKERITREGAMLDSSRLETTVGSYVHWLTLMYQALTDGDVSQEVLSAITIGASGTVVFLDSQGE